MGSDNAPLPEVAGAVAASTHEAIDEIILVGDQPGLESILAEQYPGGKKIRVVHASEVITTHDSPAVAVRQKKDASLLVALRMVKQGEADGIVSAGNTGAVHVGARTVLGPIRSVARSAICQMMPTRKNPAVLLDLGANVDCTARHLCDFAEMGMLYSKLMLNVKSPRVGLLNIGEEQVKGNEVAKAVHAKLQAARQINFVGNIEPRALFSGDADVVVCDGFVGNMILKTSEAVASFMAFLVKRELKSTWTSMLGAALASGAFRRLKKTVDPDEYPGAPLLGVNGVVVICHGSCTSQGIASAITGAYRAVDCDLTECIRAGIEEFRKEEGAADSLGG